MKISSFTSADRIAILLRCIYNFTIFHITRRNWHFVPFMLVRIIDTLCSNVFEKNYFVASFSEQHSGEISSYKSVLKKCTCTLSCTKAYWKSVLVLEVVQMCSFRLTTNCPWINALSGLEPKNALKFLVIIR